MSCLRSMLLSGGGRRSATFALWLMRPSTKRALYAFGGLTGFFVLAGTFFLAETVLASGKLASHATEIGGPYTMLFFGLYSLLNVGFLALLGVAAIRLCRADPGGVGLLARTLKLELWYFLLAGILWLLPATMGRGAAAAFGVGNMGISAQMFIAYPVTGLLAIWLLRRVGVLNGEPVAGPSCGPAEPLGNPSVGEGPPSVS
jgi:hypothetical protein